MCFGVARRRSSLTHCTQNVHEFAKTAARWRLRVHGALEVASASLQVRAPVCAALVHAAEACCCLQSEDLAGLETARAAQRRARAVLRRLTPRVSCPRAGCAAVPAGEGRAGQSARCSSGARGFAACARTQRADWRARLASRRCLSTLARSVGCHTRHPRLAAQARNHRQRTSSPPQT